MKKSAFLFLLGWITVTALGWSIGLSILVRDDRPYRLLLLALVIGGFMSSVGQWIMLRTKMKKSLGNWILATTAGIPFGLFIGFQIHELLLPLYTEYWSLWKALLIVLMITGLCKGVVQWLVLFGNRPSAIWLMLSSLSLIGIAIFYSHGDNQIFVLEANNRFVSGLVAGGLSGTITGIVDGINVMIALRRYELRGSLVGS
jgi:hypothetical protein